MVVCDKLNKSKIGNQYNYLKKILYKYILY